MYMLFFVSPLLPVDIREIVFHLISQFWNTIDGRVIKSCRINTGIPMHQHVPHPLHNRPHDFRMCFLEVFCQHICSFTNDFNIFHDSIICTNVSLKTVKREPFYQLRDVVGILNNIFKSSLISSSFSHISVSCHGWQLQKRKGEEFPLLPNLLHALTILSNPYTSLPS